MPLFPSFGISDFPIILHCLAGSAFSANDRHSHADNRRQASLGFESQLCHFTAVCLCATYPVCLSFLICKMGVRTSTPSEVAERTEGQLLCKALTSLSTQNESCCFLLPSVRGA